MKERLFTLLCAVGALLLFVLMFVRREGGLDPRNETPRPTTAERRGNGYNAATGEYGDMLEMGILDPAKVTRTALQAAGSIAGLMITTEAMIADLAEDKPSGSDQAIPGMGGMM